jgi:multidrug efflux system membrane fusion protein
MTITALTTSNTVRAFTAALLVATALTACSPSEATPAMPPPQVSVATVLQQTIGSWDEFPGRVEAVESVEIRPRVSGYIDSVNFREGQEVKKGDVLFVIDQRPYRAELARAEAELARARTQAELAKSQAARAQKLLETRAVSREEHDTRISAQAQAEANVRAAAADADVARLNLDFTEVRAPISGRAGRAMITQGNLVTAAGTDLLTTVVSFDPIYVYFDADEQAYLRYVEMAREAEASGSPEARLPVQVGLSDEEGFPHQGYLDFIDNQLNPATGTIRARALLDNADRAFTHGLFARVKLLGNDRATALLIDDKAVLTDQDRKYVYVLDAENKAVRRDIKLGRINNGLRVVNSGLQASDQVIVQGVQKVFMPGMPVSPQVIPMGQRASAQAANAS